MRKIKKVKIGPNSGPLLKKAALKLKKDAKCENKGPTILTAVVSSKGKLIRGCYGVSAKKVPGNSGQYEVIFSRNVRRGTYIGTIGLPIHLGSSDPGEITVVGRFNNANGVYITTSDSDGNRKDLGFHLAVFCPEGFAY